MVGYRTVDGSPALPPRYSFLGLVQEVDDEHRFGEGIRYIPETVTGGHISAISPTRGNVASRNASMENVPAEQTADPFVLWYGETDSVLGSFGRDYEGRVRRGFLATESYQAALEFWDGALATANGHAQEHLASLASDRLTDVSSGAVSIRNAMGGMESGLAQGLDGQPGMIHMTPMALVHAYADQCITREGNVWRSVMGHLVVADAGYTGNGPGSGEPADSTSQFIYGTGMLAVRLGKVEVRPQDHATRVGTDYAGELGGTSNDTIVLAQRPAVIQWNENVHLAAEVNIGTIGFGGTS